MPRDELGILSEIKKNFILRKLSDGVRGDGRKFDEFREISIQTNYVPRAAGSAMVTIGKTRILAGVKIEIGEPFPDTPNQGVLTTNVELLPISFPTFESGPPNEVSIEISRVVDRGIREGKTIELKDLVIEEGKKVWIVFIDIDVLDVDGNIFDACNLGAVAALRTAVIPGEAHGFKDAKLPVNNTPVSVTFAKLGDWIVADPTIEEEQMSSARVTVTTTEDGHIRAMQKGLSGTFTWKEIEDAINTSIRLGKEIREKYLQGV